MTNIPEFNHTTDGKVIFHGDYIMTLEQFMFLEPSYYLDPELYAGRLFSPGQYHYLIRVGDGAQIPQEVNWAAGIGYLNKLDSYKFALSVKQDVPPVRANVSYDRSLLERKQVISKRRG